MNLLYLHKADQAAYIIFKEDLSVPAKLWWHHSKHVDPVAQLQGDGHGEPAGAQPGVGFLPETQGHLFVKKKNSQLCI